MSPLRAALADYLAVRRALGYKLAGAELLLGQFIAYLEKRGEQTIRAELALAWATLPTNAHPSWPWLRLSIIRGFAAHLKTIDPATEVPASDLLPRRRRRRAPYLCSDEQVDALIAVAETLKTAHRVATYQTLIGLLAVTGMRAGEAIRLDRCDVDFRAELIVVRRTKFNKSRELALHRSTARALQRYLQRADRPRRASSTEAVFVSTAGTRLLYSNAASTFRLLVDRAGIAVEDEDRPRLAQAPAEPPRSAPQLRRAHDPRRLPQRRRGRRAPGSALHLPRPCRSRQHVLVPLSGAGADGAGRRAP